MISLLLAMQMWTSADPQGRNKAAVPLEGMWQSCLQDDGEWAEVFYAEFADSKGEKLKWEFHMGPGTSFALYERIVAGPHDHKAAGNRMLPDNEVSWSDMRRVYTLWEVGLRITISRLAEDHRDCEKFYVRVANIKE